MHCRLLSLALVTLLITSADSALGHSETGGRRTSTFLHARASLTVRAGDFVQPGEPWLIPGALLGGEALPPEEGAQLDDVQLRGAYQLADHYAVHAKLSSHPHGDEGQNLELENMYLAADFSRLAPGLLLDIGQMASEITPSANWHASQGDFTEAPLISDVFFGRHFVDTGARGEMGRTPLRVGLELWNGDSWPASQAEGGASLYVRGAIERARLTADYRFWGMHSEAENRRDDRYISGHSHGGVEVISPTSDIGFSGDIDMAGAFLSLAYNTSSWTLGSEFEWIRAESDGSLADLTQSVPFESTYEGMRFSLAAGVERHTWMVQHEELLLQNYFRASVSPLFLTNSGLFNPGFDPSKTTALWRYRVLENVAIRLQYVREELSDGVRDSRIGVGLQMGFTLLGDRPHYRRGPIPRW